MIEYEIAKNIYINFCNIDIFYNLVLNYTHLKRYGRYTALY